ncbi:hypothetical protein, partial [Rhodoblastus sp.]|uniref:hypothetical protein n=1 Tax=Rhodoblastus sp. TaxID=1962975 RepID=UPI003F9E89E0
KPADEIASLFDDQAQILANPNTLDRRNPPEIHAGPRFSRTTSLFMSGLLRLGAQTPAAASACASPACRKNGKTRSTEQTAMQSSGDVEVDVQAN